MKIKKGLSPLGVREEETGKQPVMMPGQKERFVLLLQIPGKRFSSAPNQVVKDMLV